MQNLRLEHPLDEQIRLDAVRHLGHPDLDDQHRVRHLGDLRHLDHPDQDDLGHLDAVPDDPCPATVRMGCYLDVRLDAEYPCPEPKQTGCCLGEECQRHQVPVAWERSLHRLPEQQAQQVRQALPEQLVQQQERLKPLPLALQAQPEPEQQAWPLVLPVPQGWPKELRQVLPEQQVQQQGHCLLYTSDAADD